MSGSPSDWYRAGFFRDYTRWAVHEIPAERTAMEVDGLVEILGLAPGERVLDLACGHGRHSLELARRGFRVTGVDLEASALEHARAAAEAEGLDVAFLRADMREIPGEGGYDAVVNVFTAFGYLESDAEDGKVLREVARVLRPGGRFLLETINLPWLFSHWESRRWQVTADGGHLLFEDEYDPESGRLEARWLRIAPDGTRREHRFGTRAYLLVELRGMLADAGLVYDRALGHLDGRDYSKDTRRMVVIAHRE